MRLRRVALLGWLAMAAACSSRAPATRPNVIVLMIDTLRRDAVGWYGGAAAPAPFLDSLAAHAAVFSRAYSTSSWTSPSVASIFTARFPSQTGIVAFTSVLDPSERTLAEELQHAGYATGGFIANPLVMPERGYGQGFDRYELIRKERGESPLKVRAAQLCGAAETWIDETRRERPGVPLFLWLHFMEPHEPLQPPKALLQAVASARGADDARIAELETMARPKRRHYLAAMPREKIDLVRDLYAAEIASLDAELDKCFAALDRRGVLRDSLIVVVADHGEEFYEHGAFGHGHSLFEELIRIPMLIAPPGQSDRVEVGDVVSIVDLAPTILAAAGVASPPTFEGRSRFDQIRSRTGSRSPAAAGGTGTDEMAFSEVSSLGRADFRPRVHRRSLVLGSEKLIDRLDGKIEAYDLAADPTEQQPEGLSAGRSHQLGRALETLQARLDQNRQPERTQEIDPETRERMRALGYEAPVP